MPPAADHSGALVLVATPIGNLGDCSARAVETLRTADVICCEDTRHTRKLLNHFDIRDVQVVSVHEHNEQARSSFVIDRVAEGATVALVTDAGMPAISDPGERVVAAVAAAGLRVTVVPGASAVLGALAVSGLPTDRFCFEGFLPRKGKDRRERLDALRVEARTSVIYESPHRLAATAAELAGALGGDRRAVMVRELTKLHEEVWRGTLAGLVDRLAEVPPLGECVLVVAGRERVEVTVSDDDLVAALERAVASGATRRDAVDMVATAHDVPRRRVYALAIAVPGSGSPQGAT